VTRLERAIPPPSREPRTTAIPHARSARGAEPHRWIRSITAVAILAPLPYSLSRLVWAAGIPLGIDEELLRSFDSPGLGSLYIVLLAVLAEGTAWYTHALVASRRRTVPARIPLAGGRTVRPALVVVPLLAPLAILAGFNLWSLGPIVDGFTIPAGNDGLPGWSFWGQVATFWVWGVSLAVATAAYWRDMRRGDAERFPAPVPARG
jgi:hypothetical protein